MDLRELLILIVEQKGTNADLCLDYGCTIAAADPRPLVKVINYILNYLTQLTDETIQINLNAQLKEHHISFIVYHKLAELPPVNQELRAVIESYRGRLEFEHQPGKYVQFRLVFSHEGAPAAR